MAALDAALLAHIHAIANRPQRDRGATRAIYSYPAKFQAHLPAELIRLFSQPGELVVDPFSGGGTTGLESYLAGRAFFGVDLNPLAPLLGRVKTTPLAAADARGLLEEALAARAQRAALFDARGQRPLFDADEAALLGPVLTEELERLAAAVLAAGSTPAADLLLVALIHTVRTVGRRDFAAPSCLPLFRRRAERIIRAVAALPRRTPAPGFRVGSAAALSELGRGEARLVVTSPPYKDLDVEYGVIQLQRRTQHRSKRSRVLFKLLGTEPLAKSVLCGGRGATYGARLRPALAEIRRVLAPKAFAFFWIGFKTAADREAFLADLSAAELHPRHLLAVALGRDRVASSRSTHHGRATGMLARDYLIVCQ
jgi:hypothetical protein